MTGNAEGLSAYGKPQRGCRAAVGAERVGRGGGAGMAESPGQPVLRFQGYQD